MKPEVIPDTAGGIQTGRASTAEGILAEKKYPQRPFILIAAALAGIGIGWLFRIFPSLDFIRELTARTGELYLRLIEMTILPLTAAAIVSGIGWRMRDGRFAMAAIRFVAVIMLAVLAGTAISVLTGYAASGTMAPSAAATETVDRLVREQNDDLIVSIAADTVRQTGHNVLSDLQTAIPKNVFDSLVSNDILAVLIFAVILGILLGVLRGKSLDVLLDLSDGLYAAFALIIRFLMYALPAALILLIPETVASLRIEVFNALSGPILVAWFTGIFIALLLAVVIGLRTGVSFPRCVRLFAEPLAVSMLTGSAFAAIPAGESALRKHFRIPARNSAFTLPMAIMLVRAGELLYAGIAVSFIAGLYGSSLPLDRFGMYTAGVLSVGLRSIGLDAAKVPDMLSSVLPGVGLPIQTSIALLAAVDIFIRPVRTLVSVMAGFAVSVFSSSGKKGHAAEGIKPIFTIRVSVIALISILISISGFVTLYVSASGSKKSSYYLAERMIREVSLQISEKTIDYIKPAERTIGNLEYLFEQGLIPIHPQRNLFQYYRSLLDMNREFVSIYFADTDGNFFMVKRMPDGSYSRRVINRTATSVSIDWIHENPGYSDQFRDENLGPGEGYDPRTRPWYRNALDAGKLVWTDVYVFASDNMPGLSCAIPIQMNGQFQGVLSIDIGVSDFSYFLGEIGFNDRGTSVILNRTNEIIALSVKSETDVRELFDEIVIRDTASGTLELSMAEESRNELVRIGYLEYLKAQESEGIPVFVSGGKRYLSMFLPFPENPSLKWKIGTIIPEDIIMGRVNRMNIIILAISIFLTILTLITGALLSRSITNPLTTLSDRMTKVRALNFQEAGEVETFLIEVHQMDTSYRSMINGLRSFRKFVPADLVLQLMKLGIEAESGGEKKDITVFFSDIKDFTTISERLRPEELLEKLEQYLSMMSRIISGNGGTVDKYMGDAVMAFWGAPLEDREHALHACTAALACRDTLRELLESNRSPLAAADHFFTRIGINSGEAIVGNMGSDERLNYTAIGDNVNLGSRLEGLNKVYGTSIIISESTHALVRGYVTARLLDKVAVKGKTTGVPIYELVSLADRADRSTLEFTETANLGAARYFERRWTEAENLFKAALVLRPDDPGVKLLLDRIAVFKKDPPSAEWDGVYAYDKK